MLFYEYCIRYRNKEDFVSHRRPLLSSFRIGLAYFYLTLPPYSDYVSFVVFCTSKRASDTERKIFVYLSCLKSCKLMNFSLWNPPETLITYSLTGNRTCSVETTFLRAAVAPFVIRITIKSVYKIEKV
jgi:hypothetical protein